MEKVDSLYFMMKGVVPFEAIDLEDYLINKDIVKHRRNGIVVLIPSATLEVIPEVIRGDDGIDYIGYSWGKIHDRTKGISGDVYIHEMFFEGFVKPRMVDINNPESISVRTFSNLLLEYKKSFHDFSILWDAMEFCMRLPDTKKRLAGILKEGLLKPRPI